MTNTFKSENCNAKFALTNRSYSHIKKLSSMSDTFTKFKKSLTNPATWPDNLEWIVTDTSSSSSTKKQSSKFLKEVKKYSASPSDLAFLQYTSGSTSEPKGVMITHGNLADNLTKITNELQATDDTVCVSWLPQYHDMGLIGSYLGALYCGGCGYYMSPLIFLQRPVMWIEAVSKFRATHLQAPNFAFKLTARKFDPSMYCTRKNIIDGKELLDLSSVRHIINAAEPVTEESINLFFDSFCPFGLKNDVMFPTYGLAEHTVFVCSGGKQKIFVSKRELEIGLVKEIPSGNGDDVSRLLGCGFPYKQNVDVRIVSPESAQELEDDQVGEIWIRSKSKANGYFKKPVETQSEFCAQVGVKITEDGFKKVNNENYDVSEGFLRSGDLGFLHKKELFICGRIKDLIILGGRNYYPQDIESSAESNVETVRPGCSAAFTVDPISGGDEEVALILELREVPKVKDVEGHCLSIIELIRSSVNKEHSLSLSHIVLLQPRTVPKTTSGKIARSWCRKAFIEKKLKIIYSKSYNGMQSSRIESDKSTNTNSDFNIKKDKMTESQIRNLDKKKILNLLLRDISQIVSMPLDSISQSQPLLSIMDSLSISQFKGMIESNYSITISDEYLFREETTVEKLVEVVKLGYAPDDDEIGESGTNPSSTMPSSGHGGLAGALGCPPGVVCCVIV